MRKITLFLALMVAMVTTTMAQTFEIIDIASNADKMLYSNAPCTDTSWGDEFKTWQVLFDNDAETIFHSEYASGKASVDGLDHYLRVDMGEGNSVSLFKFTFTTRAKNCDVNSPLEMVVEGSNEADGAYTEIAKLTDLPTTNATVYNSDVLGSEDVAYRYIRYRVTETLGHKNYPTGQIDANGKVFFFISEFGMSRLAATVEPEPEPEQQSLRLLNTRPSSNDEIEGIATSWEFIFSEGAKVADNAVKELEIKNEANEVIACVGLTGVGSYENSIFTSIAPIDTIWNEYYDEYTGETIKYPSMVYPTGLNTPGIYTMTIPAGTFVSAQDNNIAIAETILTFNVVAPKPNWWTDYDYTPTVKEFETITISFENVKEVKLNEGVAPMLYTATGAEYTGTAELVKEVDEKEGKTTYKIKVSFGEKFSEEDQYYIMIPAEMFTMDNEVSNEEKQITLEILAPVEVTPLAIESITPKFGENGEFLEVWIVYNQRVYCGNQENYWSYYVVNLTDADGNQYPMWQKDPYDPAQGWAQVIPGNTVVLIPVKTNEEGYPYEYNEYGQVLISPITTPGQYTLNLADVTVRYGYDAVAYDYSAGGYCEGTEVITIGEDTAVEGIEAEAENAEIYDLTGRRVEKITNAGIYIVNGVKKVIK